MRIVRPGQPGESWNARDECAHQFAVVCAGRSYDPVSSNRSLSIEVFAWLRRSWITHDPSMAHWINVDFVVVRDFYFD
jgi:hypothetical protein